MYKLITKLLYCKKQPFADVLQNMVLLKISQISQENICARVSF